MYGSARASAIFMSHPCPFSVAAARYTAPTETVAGGEGVNKIETTLSEIIIVQVLILICQHRLPARRTVIRQVSHRSFH